MTPRWLKLSEAARYAAINPKRLIMLAQEGKVRGGKDPGKRGDWVFDRLSLDSYREESMPTEEARAQALELMKGAFCS
jgi:hypothetical protein